MSSDAEVREPGIWVEAPGSQGVQIGEHNEQLNQFIQTYIKEIHLPRPRAPGPRVVGEVPQKAPAFQAREELITRLGESGPDVTVVRAVTGMRGVGKTQLAAAYARMCIDAGWRLVAWVNAGDPATVLNGLADIAASLSIGEPDADLETLAEAVRNRLEAEGERCLVVFDNATDLDALIRYVPVAGQCQVIITSNQFESGGLGEAVPVGVFTDQEALSFLARRTGRSDEAGARELAAELGFLPLALAQAAAVIAAQHLSYLAYLARLRTVPVQDLLKRTAGEPYPYGAAEAIVLALDAVADGDPTGLCRGLINLVALLSTAGVSRALLYAAGQKGLLKRPLTGAAAEPVNVDEALGRLASASLLSFSVDDSAVAAHRLTTRVAVEQQAQGGSLAGLGTGAAGLLTVVTQSLPQPWRNRPAARDAVQQIMALHQHLAPYLGEQDAALTETTLLRLRGWAIWCLNQLGDSFPHAIEYAQNLVADFERILGDTHPGTLASRNNLARLTGLAGDAAEARAQHEALLPVVERVLGPEHPLTLNVRAEIAHWTRKSRGRRGRGRERPETPAVRSDRPRGTEMARGPARAAGQYAALLPEFQRILGPDHPDTLAVRAGLAWSTGEAKDTVSARDDFAVLLPVVERVLGPEHPLTLNVRAGFARWTGSKTGVGDAAGARDQFAALLAMYERTMGPEHPDTLYIRHSVARWTGQAGDPAGARDKYKALLPVSERILGPDHPDTGAPGKISPTGPSRRIPRRTDRSRGRWAGPVASGSVVAATRLSAVSGRNRDLLERAEPEKRKVGGSTPPLTTRSAAC